MSGNIIHYFFGEIGVVNTTRIFSKNKKKFREEEKSKEYEEESSKLEILKKHLDTLLPEWVERAEQAAGDKKEAELLCKKWSTIKNLEKENKLGVISFPLKKDCSSSEEYCHLICWFYFTWASGGRASRSAHAMILSQEQWESIDYDPFLISPPLKTVDEFNNIEEDKLLSDFSEWSELTKNYEYVSKNIINTKKFPKKGKSALLISYITKEDEYRELIYSMSEELRRDLAFWSGSFGIKKEYQDYFHFGQGKRKDNNTISLKSFREKRGEEYQLNKKWKFETKKNLFSFSSSISVKNENHKRKTPEKIIVKKTTPKKIKLWVIVPSIIASIIFISYIISSKINEKSINKWVDSVDKGLEKEVIGLLIEGNTLKKNNPDSSDIIDSKIEIMIRKLDSQIIQMTSSGNLQNIHKMIIAIDSLINIKFSSKVNNYWNTKEKIKTLHDAEKKIIDINYTIETVHIRRRDLNEMKSFYVNIPREKAIYNPYIDSLEKETVKLEAKLEFNTLVNKWRNTNIITNNANALIEDFNSETLSFQKKYYNLLNKEFIDLKINIYGFFINLKNKNLTKDYKKLRKNYNLDSFQETIYKYNESINLIPLDSVGYLSNKINIIDADQLYNDLETKDIIFIRANRVSIGKNNSLGECEYKPTLSLNFYDNICIKSMNSFRENKIITVFDLLKERNKFTKVKIKWPKIQSYTKTLNSF